jgi:hypothetical protein
MKREMTDWHSLKHPARRHSTFWLLSCGNKLSRLGISLIRAFLFVTCDAVRHSGAFIHNEMKKIW